MDLERDLKISYDKKLSQCEIKRYLIVKNDVKSNYKYMRGIIFPLTTKCNN